MVKRSHKIAVVLSAALLASCAEDRSRPPPAPMRVPLGGASPASSSGSPFAGTSTPVARGAAPAPVTCAAHPALVGSAVNTSLSSSVSPVCLRAGAFVVHWRPGGALGLTITHASAPNRPVWSSVADRAFVVANHNEATVHGANTSGFYRITDALRWEAAQQSVTSVAVQGSAVEVRGALSGGPSPLSYRVRFEPQGARQLGFAVEVDAPANRVRWVGASDADERFLGFGEQFNHVDHKGLRVPILAREQGIGRGLQPLTSVLNAAQGVGGDWSHTYAPMALTITDRQRGLILEDSEYAEFDLTPAERWEVKLFARRMRGRLLQGPTLLDLIREATEVTGRMQPLPDWIHAGVVVGMTGGERAVLDMQTKLAQHNVPVAGWFLQDWVGERNTLFGTRLWWNWESDPATYPDWTGLVSRLRGQGQHVLSYVNPYLVDANAKGSYLRNLYTEAEQLGYLVRRPSGAVYAFDQGGYSAGLVDLSNPAAYAWLKQVIKDQILTTGVSGWMGDFGEALPLDAQLHAGDPASYHNRYPEEWQRLQREAVAEAGLAGQIVFFSRSGYTRSPGITRLFWAGDQLTTWDEHDGLKSSIVALLSSGLSGMSLNHTDVGGYTTIGVGPFVPIRRSKELMLRWMEVNAFTPVYRTHGGLHPDAGHQLDTDAETLDRFARMGHVFAALLPYRKQLMQEAADHGWPLVRHPILHDEDPRLLGERYSFMLGSEYFVAPVTGPGETQVSALLPRGRWVEVWSGRVHGDPAQLTRVTLAAPLGKPAVLYREGSAEGARFVAELQRRGLR